MKLNHDSVRAILLYLEENQTLDSFNTPKQIHSSLIVQEILKKEGMTAGYEDDLIYAIKQLYESRMISALNTSVSTGASYLITDITPSGHEFLENIRDDNTWKNVKNLASKVGNFSIKALSLISKVYAEQLIKTMFNE